VDRAPAVNARDRIGRGPWQNFNGEVVAQNVEDLHSDNNKLRSQILLTEWGTMVAPDVHDVSPVPGRTVEPFLQT
jgi:hypothetical protein